MKKQDNKKIDIKDNQNDKKNDKKIENIAYNNYLKEKLPKSEPFFSLLFAFLIGGLICVIGQGFSDILKLLAPALTKKELSDITVSFLIFMGALLTGFGVYDDIGKFAGAGSIIPITGFANSMVSPSIEFKTEGWVYGIQSKMFVIAGPVIVSGVVSAVIIGIIYSFI